MTMLRLAERVMGEGRLTREDSTVAHAGYELSRYHQFAVEGGGLRARGEIVEGHLHLPQDALEPLLGTAAPLTLHLDDGRCVNLYVVNLDGVITSADERGFYHAP
jgi:hypothetical protein